MTIVTPPPAPPTMAAPPPLTPAGRTAVRVLLVIAASVLIIGCVASLVMVSLGIKNIRMTSDEQALPADLKALLIDTGDAPAAVRLTTDPDAREPRVSMRLFTSTDTGDQSLAVTQEGDVTRLSVTGNPGRFMAWGRTGQITVTLPPKVARGLSVTARLDDAGLVAESDLDSLEVTNIDGDVVLGGSARRVEIHTRDGDVVARKPIAVRESFLTSAVDGDIRVDFADAPPRRVEATTRDGDVEISLPGAGPYLVRASGDAAWVDVPETNDPARAVAEVTVRTVDGTVDVHTGDHRPERHG